MELITKQPNQRLKGIKEWNFGVFEGSSEALSPGDQLGRNSYGDFFAHFKGETDYQVQDRLNATLTDIMEQAKDEENVLAVSHGGAIHMFLLKWMDVAEMKQKVVLHNCTIIKLTYDDHKFNFEKLINVVE